MRWQMRRKSAPGLCPSSFPHLEVCFKEKFVLLNFILLLLELTTYLHPCLVWKFKPFSPADESAFTAGAARLFQDNQSKFNCIMPHGPYLMNLCTPDLSVLEKSRNRLLEELAQCNRLGINLYNFHPGSNVRKEAVDVCVDRMHASLNFAHSHADSGNVVTVLESTAGSGSSIGGSFEQLAAIIAGVQDKSRVGICLDTCHMFAKGSPCFQF